MALDDVFNITRPNARNGGADPLALIIEEFTGLVEGTLERKSLTRGWVPMRNVQGTSTIRVDGVGSSQLQALVPGTQPDGTPSQFGKTNLTIDTVVLARESFPLLDQFQSNYDKRKEVAMEQGKTIAKFLDQAMFIQAIKASLLANSKFHSTTELPGHAGGTTETLALAGDVNDPAKINSAINRLFAAMEAKDVDPQGDDLIIACRPDIFYRLLEADVLINTEYVTSEGNSVNGMVLKTYGVPVLRTNNFPAGSNITGHLLSNAGNGNAYNGDFTKVVLTAFSPRALLAGETIPLASDVFYDKLYKAWFVDSHLSFGVTPRRAEMAGSILIP